MKKEVLLLNALAVMERLEQGKSVEGGMSKDPETGCIVFRPYNRLSREPGYIPPSVTLRETANGALRQTAQRNKVWSASSAGWGISEALSKSCRRPAS
jgi:hypothetical protein